MEITYNIYCKECRCRNQAQARETVGVTHSGETVSHSLGGWFEFFFHYPPYPPYPVQSCGHWTSPLLLPTSTDGCHNVLLFFFFIYKTLAYQLDLFNHKEKGDMSDSWLHAWCSRGICLGSSSSTAPSSSPPQVPVEVHCGGINLVRICTNLCLGSRSPGFSRFDAIQCSSLHTIFNLTNL